MPLRNMLTAPGVAPRTQSYLAAIRVPDRLPAAAETVEADPTEALGQRQYSHRQPIHRRPGKIKKKETGPIGAFSEFALSPFRVGWFQGR